MRGAEGLDACDEGDDEEEALGLADLDVKAWAVAGGSSGDVVGLSNAPTAAAATVPAAVMAATVRAVWAAESFRLPRPRWLGRFWRPLEPRVLVMIRCSSSSMFGLFSFLGVPPHAGILHHRQTESRTSGDRSVQRTWLSGAYETAMLPAVIWKRIARSLNVSAARC